MTIKTAVACLCLSLAFVAGVVAGAQNSQPEIRKIEVSATPPMKTLPATSTQEKPSTKPIASTTSKAVEPAQNAKTFLNKSRSGYTVLLSSFKVEENANKYARKIAKKGYDAFYFSKEIQGKVWHRVGVGSFSTKSTAESLKKQLTENRLGKGSLITTIPKSNL